MLVLLLAIIILAHTQVNPTWTTTPYIQSKSFFVVNTGQKLFGTYNMPITFFGIFPSQDIALSIPQLRITSNNSAIGFKVEVTSPNTTGFIHKLTISSITTSVYFMVNRYFVISKTLLPNAFYIYLYGNTPAPAVISTGSGVRTQTFPITLNPLMDIAKKPTCAPFLVGLESTSPDYSQANITCLVTANNVATITVTVNINVKITQLDIYLITFDTDVLSVQSVFFVDYANTYTTYGVQKSFLTLPQGFLDLNYIGGLSSFSFINNFGYNLTLSLPSTSVSTTTNSFFNSITQLQIRLRLCPISFPYYNIGDSLCYPICPTATYSNSTIFVCYNCSTNCISCLNPTSCTTCSSAFQVDPITFLCVCPKGFYELNNNCYGCDYTCQTCTATGQYYNCLTCDAANQRIPFSASPFNFECRCNIPDFNDTGQPLCDQNCGDGKAIIDPCDDGNNVSGDGCSSTCINQTYFTCSPPSSTSKSNCKFTANTTITVARIIKDEFSNRATFYIKIQPWVSSMTQLANKDNIKVNFSVIHVSHIMFYDPENDQPYIAVTVQYLKNMENQLVRVDLMPSPNSSSIFSTLPPTNITITAISKNAYPLIIYTQLQYDIASSFRYVTLVFGFLMMGSAILYIFGRLKWMGNSLYFSLQFQYLSMVIIPKFNPMLSGLSYFKSLLGYDGLWGYDDWNLPKYSSFYALRYSTQYIHNVNFMVLMQIIALIMYIIYYITYRRNELLCKKYGGNPEKTYRSNRLGKFLSFFNFQYFIFWTLFNMTNQVLSMILSSQNTHYGLLPLILFNVGCIIAALFPFFLARKQIPSYTQLLYYKDRGRQQQLVTMIGFFIMYLMLAFSLVVSDFVYNIITIVPLVLIIYLLYRRPFQSNWIRVTYFINNFCIIMSLIYNKIYLIQGDNVYYLPFGNFAIIIFDWAFNLIVWIREAYIICKYGGEQGLNQVLQSHTKTTQEQQEQQQNYFKNQTPERAKEKDQSLLQSYIKKSNNQMTKQKNKKIQMTRKQRERQIDLDEQTPAHIKQKRKQAILNQEAEEQAYMDKKRQEWARQNNLREIRQRSRIQVEKQNLSTKRSRPTLFRSTRQKGVDPSKVKQVLQGTIRYM